MLVEQRVVHVAFGSDLNFGALEYTALQVGVMDIHALHEAVGTCKFPGFDGFPNTLDFRRR